MPARRASATLMVDDLVKKTGLKKIAMLEQNDSRAARLWSISTEPMFKATAASKP